MIPIKKRETDKWLIRLFEHERDCNLSAFSWGKCAD